MIRRPPRSTQSRSSAASDVYKRQDTDPSPELNLVGRRALIVCTNHGWLDIGKPTGVFASEMTVPYYAFLDAGMDVDLASPEGGLIPVDPMSLKPIIRSASDDRSVSYTHLTLPTISSV